MKKLILITIMMLLIGVSAFSIELYTFGGMSYDFDQVGQYYDEDKVWFETSLAAGVQHSNGPLMLYMEAETVTEMYKSPYNMITFVPTYTEYYTRVGLWVHMFYFEYAHACFHNIDYIDNSRRGGHNRVTVGFDSRRMK